jgi:hypothetical protein
MRTRAEEDNNKREDRIQDTKEQTKCEVNLKQCVSLKGNSISIVIGKG